MHLVSLNLGVGPTVINNLRGQEMELDVGLGDARSATDETPTLQVCCGPVT